MIQTLVKPHVYQAPVIIAVKKALETRDKALFIMATGLGKTIVSALVVEEWLLEGKRGLFLCHENDILAQGEKEYRKVIQKDIVYKTFYGKEEKDWTADNCNMLFASFQALNNWHEKWYMAFDKDHFDFMVVDEVHHGQAPTYKEVIDYFTCKKIGMTATPDRMDEKDIRDIFGKEVYTITLEEGIANGWLTNVEYHIVSDGINNRKLKKICRDVLGKGKRISVKQLNETIFIEKRDLAEKWIIDEYTKIKKYARGRKTMMFCENIEHADTVTKYFDVAGVVHSKRTDKHNKQVLADFREGLLQYVSSVDKFNEGIDVPDVEVVVFLRATDSMTVFFQQLGRALRKTALKSKVIVLDFVANCERLIMVRDLMNRIREIKELNELNEQVKLPLDVTPFHVTGEGFEFIFSDEMVDIMKVIEALREGFYSTCREASKAAIKLGIKTGEEYFKRRKEDLRLPGYPYSFYTDFPGWKKFLGTNIFYSTWQQASKVARGLKIANSREYLVKRKTDIRLPASPDNFYEKDFPGWYVFLGKKSPKNFTKKELIKQLQAEAKRLGRTPTSREINKASKDGRVAPAMTFVNNFGNFNAAFKAAKLEVNLEMKFRSLTKKDLVRQLKDEAKRLGRTPLQKDVKIAHKEGRMSSYSALCKKLGGSLRMAYQMAELTHNRKEMPVRYTKKMLIKQLKAEAKRLKRKLTEMDINNSSKKGRTASSSTFIKHFGKISKAFDRAGVALNPRRPIGKHALIKQLKSEAEKINRTPRITDINESSKAKRTASIDSLVRVFGSYNKALKAARLKLNVNRKN